jgi:CHASE2 domain-containing sensor protein
MRRLPTAPLAAAGLIAGFAVADATGNRPLGGVVLAAGGILCALAWYRRSGTVIAGSLAVTYTAAFALSHPLAKQIGSWPSVFVVAAVTAGAAYTFSDRRFVKNGASGNTRQSVHAE